MKPGAGQQVDDGGARPSDLVELGVLRGAYGLQGWSHVQAHSADARALREARRWWLSAPGAAQAQGAAQGPLEVTGVRAQGAGFVAKWRGCEDPETAQKFKGWRVAVSRAEFPPLPDGQYYWVDLIGAQVVNRGGLVLGAVQGLRNNGAHDLLEVARDSAAQPALIPMVEAYLDEIDLPGRRIRKRTGNADRCHYPVPRDVLGADAVRRFAPRARAGPVADRVLGSAALRDGRAPHRR
jgi:16S rRNA processing protein RimM